MRLFGLLIAASISLALVHPAYAQAWGQLKSAALDAEAARKYDSALEFWHKALAACENKSGPRYVQSLGGLANCYAEQGKNAEAEDAFKKIAASAKEGAVSDDEKTALSNYAEFLHKQNREPDAAELRTKFSLVQQKQAPPPVSETAFSNPKDERRQWQSLINDGTKELGLKNYAQAETLFQQALSIAEKHSDYPKMMNDTLGKIIVLYYAQDKYDKAEPIYVKSMAIVRKSNGADSDEYTQALRSHAMLLRKLNRKTEAMAEEAKADEIAARHRYESAGGSSSGSGAMPANTSAPSTRGGSLYQRARAASQLNDINNQNINGLEQ